MVIGCYRQYDGKKQRSIVTPARFSKHGDNARCYRSFVADLSIRDDGNGLCEID
jgi:hypothetical protein